MPLKKKKYNARFPAGRIKKIMQTDEEVGKVAQAVPVIISRTLEMFVESLLTKSLHVTLSRNAKTLSPSHLKQCILAEQRFDFLRDLVKSIPDVSPAEEKEGTQNWSAENSPNSCRYDVRKPKLSSYPSVASQTNSAHSSDSSSDCELSKTKLGSFGNGKYTTIKTEKISDDERGPKVAPYPVPNCNVVPSHSIPSIIVQPQQVSLTTSHRPTLNRPTNFYQETLRDVDEKRDSPPVHSSVIQPNPEYSGLTSTKLKNTIEQPKLLLDLSKGLPSDLNILGSSKPVFHFDLSSVPLTPGSSDGLGPPFTPTLLRQPQTPLLFNERNISKTSSDSYYKNMLHRSESFNQTRKEPPPLQTLKRAASFDNSRTSTKRKSTSDSSNLPQIKIDIANDGHSPMYHLDLSNFKFDASSSSPSPITPKKRKYTPNEPPGLLPINPTQRPPLNLSKNSVASMQLDEDYDT